MSQGRVWLVAGPAFLKYPQALEAAGGHLVLQRQFNKLTVWLFEPKDPVPVSQFHGDRSNSGDAQHASR